MSAERFAELLSESRVVVLVAKTDAAARACVIAGLAERSPDVPVFEWVAGTGFAHPTGGAPDGAPPAGADPDEPAAAIRAVQRWGGEAVLLMFGADDWKNPAGVAARVTRQQDDADIASWLVFVSRGGDVTALVGGSAEPFTLDLRAKTAAPAPAAPRKKALDLKDLRDREAFGSDDWSRHLDELPPKQLAEICDRKLYEPCLGRVDDLARQLKRVFVDKDEVIDLMTAAAVAQVPLLLLGPAGTGKSMLVREFSKGLGIAPQHRRVATEDQLLSSLAELAGDTTADPLARHDRALNLLFGGQETRHFEYLVTRFTTPEELVGTVNIEVMLKFALHLRQTRGLLPRAEVVFLDEVFKANSAILNSLLSIINEKLIYNAGVPWKVNLVMLFGASNEPPQDADLAAFFDRFPIRVLCRSVAGDRVKELLKSAHAQSVLSLLPRNAKPDDLAALDPKSQLKDRRVEAMASVNDFRLLRMVCLRELGGVDLSDGSDGAEEFVGRFETAFRHLRDEYGISDRSCAHYYRLARARALVAGRGLNREDVRVLQYSGKDADDLRKLPGIVDQFI